MDMRISSLLLAGSALALAALPEGVRAQTAQPAEPRSVTAVGATQPMDGGATMAVLARGTDPAQAQIIGTADHAGIELYRLDGSRVAPVAAGEGAGLDVRDGFRLGNRTTTLVATADGATNGLRFFTHDKGVLTDVGARPFPLGFEVENVCLWQSANDGNVYAFALGNRGQVDQQLVYATSAGKVDMRPARRINLASEVNHCVADDAGGQLYVAERSVGIWRIDANPEIEVEPRLIDAVRLGKITKKVGGLALYNGGSKANWLIAADASTARLFVYDRAQDDRWLGAVTLKDTAGAPLEEPGGLFAAGAPLGERFPHGLLIAADDKAAAGASRYQLVSIADIAAALGLDPGTSATAPPVKPGIATVTARVETVPVKEAGDAADDPAIWANPADPAASLIVGTDKKAGLYLYDMKGQVVDFTPVGRMNNVDLRTMDLDGKPTVIVTATDRTRKAIGIFSLDTAARKLVDIADGLQPSGLSDPYGLCMYKSARTGRVYVFASDPDGLNRQWEVVAKPGGKAGLRKVRDLKLGTQTEGCVADDANAAIYIDEEDVALWRFDAEPGGSVKPAMVDSVARNKALKDDLEGISLYDLGGGKGYLVLSSQGNNTYAVYDRQSGNAYRGSFQVVADGATGIDGISETDGLDVSSADLGPGFEHGAMVAQDGHNVLPGENQNFKIVRWSDIAAALGLQQR